MTRLNEILTGAADSLRRKSFSRSNSNQGAAAQAAAGAPQTPQSPQTPSAPQRFLSVPGQERRHSSSDPGIGVVAQTQGSEWWTMTILAGSSEIMQRHSAPW